jgi:hypothetical protein
VKHLAQLRVARALHCAARMRNALFLICLLSAFAGCATAGSDVSPDASPPPIDPAGTYEVRSALHLAEPLPGPVAAFVGELTDATDDPSRFLVDRMIAALPDGHTKTIAQGLAPIVAAYLDSRISSVAPRFLPGLHAASDALVRLTEQLDTIETVRIAPDSVAVRTVTGLRVANTDVMLGVGGIGEPAVTAKVHFDRGALALDEHRLGLPYSRLLRLAIDRGIVPSIDPGAYDLATMLRDLVDCPHLGAAVADALSIQTPSVFSTACSVGMTAAALELYDHLDALDGTRIELIAHGTARGLDLDEDGQMDGIAAGTWIGTLGADDAAVSLSGATFEGTRQ